MIACHKEFFRQRCDERGYTVEECLPCVVSQEGETWTIDELHSSYPRVARAVALPAASSCFAGTELKKLLEGWPFKIAASDNCNCTARARHMDLMGCDWCERNLEEVVGYLREAAGDRGLPFLDAAGRMLVRRAVANARRKESRRVEEQR